ALLRGARGTPAQSVANVETMNQVAFKIADSSHLELLFFGQNLFHNFGRPGTDGVETYVAPHAADRILGGVGEAAHDLHAVVGDLLTEMGGVELGHSDFAHRALAAVDKIQSVIGQLPSGFDRGEMFGEAMPPHLETSHRRSEGLALAPVIDRVANGLSHGS